MTDGHDGPSYCGCAAGGRSGGASRMMIMRLARRIRPRARRAASSSAAGSSFSRRVSSCRAAFAIARPCDVRFDGRRYSRCGPQRRQIAVLADDALTIRTIDPIVRAATPKRRRRSRCFADRLQAAPARPRLGCAVRPGLERARQC